VQIPLGQRPSMLTLRPSIHLKFCKPRRNAAKSFRHGAVSFVADHIPTIIRLRPLEKSAFAFDTSDLRQKCFA
jgi:hypothetical protein